jgi:flagellar hook assembly protein FlgD
MQQDESDSTFVIESPATAVAENLLGTTKTLGVYPNPASFGGTHVLFHLRTAGMIEVTIYDLSGRVVRRLESGSFPGGVRVLTWDGRNEQGVQSGAGTYFVRLSSSTGVRATQRFTLLR